MTALLFLSLWIVSYSSADLQSFQKAVSFQATGSCGTSKNINFTALAEQEEAYLASKPFTLKSYKVNAGKGKNSTNDFSIVIPTINVYFHVITGKFCKETSVADCGSFSL
jgi:hypothetical protein